MSIGASLFLLAVGAILTFAVGATTVAGISVHVVGIILMVVGIAGLLLSLIFLNRVSPWTRRTAVVDRDVVVRDVVDRDVL